MLEDNIDPPVQQGILNLEDMLPVLMDALDEDNISESNTASRNEVDLNKTNNTISNQWYEDLSVRSVGQHIQPLIEPTIGDMDKGIAEFDFDAKETNTLPEENSTNHVDQLEIRLVNDPKDQSKPLSSDVKQQRRISSLSDVLVINVRSRKNKQIQGSDLLEQVLANGLQYGEMDIFHFHEGENSEAPVLFSMANMVKPGIFDLKTIDQLTTIGVTFFLTLPVPNDQAMIAYETMLSTAKNFSIALNAELNDDQHSVMTSQTIEHYRERILDFTRRQHLEKNK
jgi:cell division protein ZipA